MEIGLVYLSWPPADAYETFSEVVYHRFPTGMYDPDELCLVLLLLVI